MAKQNENDPHEVDVDEEIDPEQIIKKAQGTFSLDDRLNNIRYAHAQVTLFTDIPAVNAYRAANANLQAINDAAGKVDLKAEAGREMHTRLLERYNDEEKALEELKSSMLASALVVELHAWPSKVAKAVRNKSRKKFHSDTYNAVAPEDIEEANEWVDMLLFAATVQSITDANADIFPLEPYVDESKPVKKGKKPRMIDPRDTLGEKLQEQLPPSQWIRLYDAYQKVTITDQIGDSGTGEPGF